jgi:drug/metabolite transporter (DMT)-like permease
MGGAVVSFSLMAVAVRELLHAFGSFQILFLRSAFALLVMLALLPSFGAAALRTSLLGLHVLRSLLQFSGQFAWIYALGLLPLVMVVAIEFTMPVWAALLAMLFLGERMNRARVVMLALGLAGMLIVVKPGVAPVSPAAFVLLAGSVAYAATMITTRRLATNDTAFAVLFYMSAIQAPLGLITALPGWVTPGAADLPWIVALGASGLTAHFCLTRALRVAEAMIVAPIDFLRLPLLAVIGILLYDEPLEPSILLGAAVIFAGTYYSIWRESR